MHRYVGRRLLLFVPSLLLASIAIFVVMRILPGDVVLVILTDPQGGAFTAEQVQSIRAELGLADPLPVQYVRWLWSMVNGEFGGRSLSTKEPLSAILGRRLPVTLQLTLYTFALSLLSLPLGVVAAAYQNRWPDYLIRAMSVSGHALPHFWLALVFLLAMLTLFSWTPPSSTPTSLPIQSSTS